MNKLLVWPFALSTCLFSVLLGGACGGGGESSTGFTSNTGGGGTTTSSSTGTGPSTCGNGKPEPGKVCDPSIMDGMGGLEGLTCAGLGMGFSGGNLVCTSDCMLDTSGCTKNVNCFDGTTTCANPMCTAACSDPCAAAAIQTAQDPSMLAGDTSTHPSTLASMCSSSMGSGPNLVYQVKAANTGVLAIGLESGADLGVSVRTTCDQAPSEVACIDHFVSSMLPQNLVVPCTAGDTFFVVVGGYGATDAGDFTLTFKSRPIVCGDDFTDPGEQCDEGDTLGTDGCSSTCTVLSSGSGSSMATAPAYVAPWYERITSATDVQWVSVPVASAPSSITATLDDLDGHACQDGTMEAVLQIIGPDGTTVLMSQDAGLTDTCASVTATASQAGTYYVSVAASTNTDSLPGQTKPSMPGFPYKLDVTAMSSNCGSGVVGPGEQCNPPGPTCSATCQFIFSDKTPNGTCATANPFTGTTAAPWYAQITTADPVEYVSFAVPAGTTQIVVYVDDNGDGDCDNDVIVAQAELIEPDCTTVIATNDGDGSTYCPTIMATPTAGGSFPAGTYFVQVSAGPLDTTATFDYRLRILLVP